MKWIPAGVEKCNVPTTNNSYRLNARCEIVLTEMRRLVLSRDLRITHRLDVLKSDAERKLFFVTHCLRMF